MGQSNEYKKKYELAKKIYLEEGKSLTQMLRYIQIENMKNI